MFSFSCTKERNKEVPFSMAIGNGELLQECFPKHSRMGTARMKLDEDGQKRGVSMEKNTASTNKRSLDGLSLPNQNKIINKHKMVFF